MFFLNIWIYGDHKFPNLSTGSDQGFSIRKRQSSGAGGGGLQDMILPNFLKICMNPRRLWTGKGARVPLDLPMINIVVRLGRRQEHSK